MLHRIKTCHYEEVVQKDKLIGDDYYTVCEPDLFQDAPDNIPFDWYPEYYRADTLDDWEQFFEFYPEDFVKFKEKFTDFKDWGFDPETMKEVSRYSR